jgi:hypothetical protein
MNGSPPSTWLLDVFVIEHDGRPVGWIQWYLWSDYPEHALELKAELASAGIDLAIGKLAMTGLGLGPVAIYEFLRQIVFADPSVSAVITDPEEGDLRSLRAFEKAGFYGDEHGSNSRRELQTASCSHSPESGIDGKTLVATGQKLARF